jgi:hypothetical protein
VAALVQHKRDQLARKSFVNYVFKERKMVSRCSMCQTGEGSWPERVIQNIRVSFQGHPTRAARTSAEFDVSRKNSQCSKPKRCKTVRILGNLTPTARISVEEASKAANLSTVPSRRSGHSGVELTLSKYCNSLFRVVNAHVVDTFYPRY